MTMGWRLAVGLGTVLIAIIVTMAVLLAAVQQAQQTTIEGLQCLNGTLIVEPAERSPEGFRARCPEETIPEGMRAP